MSDHFEQRASIERSLRSAGVRNLSAEEMTAAVDGVLALAFGGEQPVSAGRTWAGEAQAAYDQALVEATAAYDRFKEGHGDEPPDFHFWVARASAAAAIESAQMARVGNLIAWKALQIARETRGIDALPQSGDQITESIERALGIT